MTSCIYIKLKFDIVQFEIYWILRDIYSRPFSSHTWGGNFRSQKRKAYWLAVIQWWLCGFTLAWHDHSHASRASHSSTHWSLQQVGGGTHSMFSELHPVCDHISETIYLLAVWNSRMDHMNPIWMTFFSLATQIFAKTPPHIIMIVIDDLGN